jgi:uncharacterized membrane protein YdbT with pleckstrin-like domain
MACLSRYHSRYTLTTDRLVESSGVIAKHVDEIELYRLQDTKARQSMWERLCGIGSIEVNSTDATGQINIRKVTEPHQKREQIRALSETAKRKHNFRLTE